jgi:hypothetical protein
VELADPAGTQERDAHGGSSSFRDACG